MGVVFLIVGLIVIILSANALVSGASSIAKRFGIPDLVIGLTIVSIGTSTPELAISIISALKGNTDIAVGNILGSNIANILLIIGLSAIVFPLVVQKNTQYKEIPLGILAIALIGICGNDIILDNGSKNVLSRIDGIVLLCFFIIFLYYTFQIATKKDIEGGQIHKQALWKSIIFIILGIAGLFFGGNYFVEGAVKIARYFGMSDTLIGLTIVAIGTSLPELATSIVAAYKKNPDIAVGNVVGSNILNVFLILGITATIKPLPLNPATNIDIAVALVASLLLFSSTFLFHHRKVTRVEGIIFVSFYILYLTYLIINQ
jgi:cation:H+ antiporter